MNTIAETKKHLDELLADVDVLEKLAMDGKQIPTFGAAYQRWYTKAVKLVELLGADRLAEFSSLYLADPKRKSIDASTYRIQDYLRGLAPRHDAFRGVAFDHQNLAIILLFNQRHILASMKARIDEVLSDIVGHLFAELQDSELRSASKLSKISLRAAGALAGVVLERHLQRVAKNHHIAIGKKDPAISDLNEPLKAHGIYDVPTWRKIQLLADIRNLCAHQKATEPTNVQVAELISGVAAIVKTVF